MKLTEFVNDVFHTLNNSSNELSMIEFKEFYDLTAKGLNSPTLEPDFIMKEFQKADLTGKNKVSKKELEIYISKLYTHICTIIYSELSKTVYSIKSLVEDQSLTKIPERVQSFGRLESADPNRFLSKKNFNVELEGFNSQKNLNIPNTGNGIDPFNVSLGSLNF